MISEQDKAAFLETLWNYYHDHARDDLPWRKPERGNEYEPYKIMVSELMLQQTQVQRVAPKYCSFLDRFPTVGDLAAASIGDVLREWQGLGYNRRAKFLWMAASRIVELGVFPDAQSELIQLPGVGANTAGAILAYAFNQPAVFIETNIRSVYIHHFLANADAVHDKEIRELLEQTVDHENPREFYWALMDYGSYLKATVGNVSRASKHYAKQSSFQGSRRQVRGEIVRTLGAKPQSLDELRSLIVDERLVAVIDDLVAEGMIRLQRGVYVL